MGRGWRDFRGEKGSQAQCQRPPGASCSGTVSAGPARPRTGARGPSRAALLCTPWGLPLLLALTPRRPGHGEGCSRGGVVQPAGPLQSGCWGGAGGAALSRAGAGGPSLTARSCSLGEDTQGGGSWSPGRGESVPSAQVLRSLGLLPALGMGDGVRGPGHRAPPRPLVSSPGEDKGRKAPLHPCWVAKPLAFPPPRERTPKGPGG